MSLNNDDLDALSAMEAFRDFCFSTVDWYLEEHDFPVLRDRLLLNFKGELESIQVLLEIWREFLEGSHTKLIEIYERANDRRKVVHYENLIVLFLVSFLAELLAALVAAEYSRNRRRIVESLKKTCKKSQEKIQIATQRISQKYERLLKYLFRVYALKEYLERKAEAPFDYFVLLREKIKNLTIFAEPKEEKLPEDYILFEESFLKEHSLPSIKESYSQKLSDELLSLSIVDRHEPRLRRPGKKMASICRSSVVFSVERSDLKEKVSGLGTNPGYAIGRVKVILQAADCDKAEEGDIIVLVECNPDLVRALRRAGALIADKSSITGHAGIVGRQLGLPTIVRTEKGTKVLKDGVCVFVDAVQGIVYELAS